MYILHMRTIGRLLAVLTVITLVSPWVPSLLCAQAAAGAMPCCRTQAPCDLQIQSNRCCTVERGTAAPAGSTAVLTSSYASAHVRYPQLATVDHTLSEDAVASAHPDGDRLWYPPSHDRSTPLFLRNAAILR
jgi:hypothetical protein